VSTYSGDNSTFGIDVSETLTITGNGNLTAASGDTTSGVSYGIRTNGDVIITGGTVTASGNTAALSEDPATLPAVYNWKTLSESSLTNSATYSLLDYNIGTYLYLETATGVTPAAYAFNKAVSNDVFRIDYSLAPGITFNDNVKNGTTALASATEWWSVDDNTIEITSSYLMGLDVGTYTITLDTTADVDPTVSLTVTNVYEWGLYLNASGELICDQNTIAQGTPSAILGGGSYSFADGVLTLNNVNFTTSAPFVLESNEYSAPVTLNINGSNSLVSTYNGTGTNSECIYIEQALTITGDGSLTVLAGNTTKERSVGIWSNEDVTISGTVNVTVTGGTARDKSYGIISAIGDINIFGGTLKATGGAAGNTSYGVFSGTGNVNFTGGNMLLSGKTSAANSGSVTPFIAAINYENADGSAAVRVDNTEIDLSTVKYIKTYESLSDYLRDYPRATPEIPSAPTSTPYYSNTPPPSPPQALTIDGGTISLSTNNKTINTDIRFNSKRLTQTEAYIAEKFKTTALGSFETAQKGGWGDIATITISLEKLGFDLEDGTKLYVLIFDTKTKEWQQVEAIVENGNIIIVTEWSGIFAVVNEKVL
jgi:hypothetical protein